MLVLILRSAHAQALPQSRTRVRASRRMRTATAWPSCFETHRSAAESLKATCCSRCDAPQPEGAATYHSSVSEESREAPTSGCGKQPPAPLHCFRVVIYNGWRNSNVSSRQRAVWSRGRRGRGEMRALTSPRARAARRARCDGPRSPPESRNRARPAAECRESPPPCSRWRARR